MSEYVCAVIDQKGSRTSIRINADSEGSAASEARGRGMTVISVSESEGTAFDIRSLTSFMPVSTREKILLFRMLSSLIASDITISEAMGILEEQAESAKLGYVLADVRARIEGGIPLSEAMSRHPSVFDEMAVNMIQAGELGGILDTVLVRVSNHIEKRAALKSKTIISLMYPGVVVVVATVVVIFLVVFVIPKFATLLNGKKLPANTQFLLDLADFLKSNWIEILGGFGGLVAFGFLLFSMPQTRLAFDRHKLKIPVIGSIFRFSAIVQFSRTFSALLESRIPLVEALGATGATIGNTAVKQVIDTMIERVLSGELLSSGIGKKSVFTPMVRAMMKIGEQSGLMDEAMDTVAELHEKMLEDKISRMSSLIEPVLIIVLGGIVGFVAWGLIAGMLAMYSGGK